MSANTITECLELVAERAGDPTPLIYERVFELHPEMKHLFVLDRDSSARGNMLAEFLECILDLAGERAYAVGLLQTEMINHDGLGVPPKIFGTFLSTVRDVFRDVLGADWTSAMETAWQDLITEVDGILSAPAA